MSVDNVCSIIMLNTTFHIPEKVRKIVEQCENLSDVLDALLKVFGDASCNDPQLAGTIIELIQNTCSESTLQSSEIEFTILSLQNIFHTSNFTLQSKILNVIVAILVTRESSSSELTCDVINFLLNVLEAQCESPLIQQTSLDCLLELELNIPGLLMKYFCVFLSLMKNHDLLNHKAAELVCTIMKNFGSVNQMEIFQTVLDFLPKSNTLMIASITRDTLYLNKKYLGSIHTPLEKLEKSLINRYRSCFDLCILRSLTSIQELTNSISEDNSIIISATHLAVSVARNLMALDWLACVNRWQDNCSDYEQFEPTPFDGADARLMKVMLLNKCLRHHVRGNVIFCRHLDQLVEFAQKTKTSRSLAAVFRVLNNMIYLGFPSNAIQIAIDTVVTMGSRNPSCIPHVIDFLRHTKQTEHSIILAQSIILKLIDSYDEMSDQVIELNIEHIINFFIEASVQPYAFCQPRVMLQIIRRCLGNEGNSIFCSACNGIAVLDLCQALIRNQDYEIFQPELIAVLSSLESSHKDTDVRQRSWMLCALITHVNTESLKDVFDVNMDLSIIGKIEYSTSTPLIAINILFNNRPDDTYLIAWSFERKRSSRSIYFPLEISFTPNSNSNYSEYIGIRIDFALDAKCGQADSIHIPILKMGQTKKAFLHLQPKVCTQVIIAVRAVMSTTDGRIFSSVLEDCCIKLEHMLSPISSTKTFDELWSCLVDHCESCCTSTMALPRAEKLLTAAESGPLSVFQLVDKKATELAMVTADSLLMLVRIFSMSQSWHADILVEDATLLPVAYSFLHDYSA